MSLCTTNGIVAPSLWANELPRFDVGPYDVDVTFDWRHVPDTVDEFYDWATIADINHPFARVGEKRFVYTPLVADPAWPSDNSESYEVAIVLHGFVSSCNLSPFGNWTRRESHAPAAVRSISIDAHGHDNPFNCQQHSLRVLEQFADMTEGATPTSFAHTGPETQSIRAEQNIRSSEYATSAVALTDDIDRGRHARRIARRWRVEALPPTYVRRPSGTDLPIAAHAIHAGDFVELTVNPAIRSIRRDGVLQTTLLIDITRVVKLWSTAQNTHPPGGPPPSILPIPPQPIPAANDHGAPDIAVEHGLPLPLDDDAVLPDA